MLGLQTHKINVGDSLQKIARLYGVKDWREIAELNNLHAPYILAAIENQEEKDPQVAYFGDILLIPAKKGTILPKNRNEEIEALAYGIDLDLYQEGPGNMDYKGQLEDAAGDIRLAQGLKNLAQQLTTRLSVKKGALLNHPDFGSELYKYEGRLGSVEVDNKVLFEVEHVLRSDTRVKDILDLEIEKTSRGRTIKAKIQPVEPGQPFDYQYYIE